MADLELKLESLELGDGHMVGAADYHVTDMRRPFWDWDKVVKGSHLTNCAYQQACNFNIYVKDGVVVREEQAANYPARNDPSVPDFNSWICNNNKRLRSRKVWFSRVCWAICCSSWAIC